ncbi:MAG TPA: hypothetical protein VK663_15850 [Burkholderiales bacterium]|nr:hypothetical protein [Burkholderiales bacterium]
MKWIIGGLVLGVVSAVYSGRVPMAWVVYSFAAMFVCWGLALFFAYTRSKRHGLLLLGSTFFSAGVLAVVMVHWWPLVGGFAIAWVLRAMGMDPPPEALPGEPASTPASAPDSDKNT